MRRAVMLLLGGCAQSLGLSQPVLVDATNDPDSPPADMQSRCAPRRVGATLFGSDVSMTAVKTTEGFVVLAIERDQGNLRLQRYTTALEPVDQVPLVVNLAGSSVAGLADGNRLVIGVLDVDKTRMASIPLASPSVATSGTTLTDAIAEGDAILPTQSGNFDVYAAHGTGYFHYGVTSDLNGSSAGPGGGTGGPSAGCVAAADNGDIALACPKLSVGEAYCFTTHISPNGTALGGFPEACPNISLVQRNGVAIAVYEKGGGLQLSSWANTASPGTPVPIATIPNATQPLIDVDPSGIVIAMRRQGSVYTTRDSTAAPYAPVRLEGMPSPLGFAIARGTTDTVLFVAAADGIYRACI
ncbi:MAG TPA: hypothetical protein VMZ53_08860 [Kofleriaceae bacterium]|nr:hypothetical protein [Kofleriaceae bacterium]